MALTKGEVNRAGERLARWWDGAQLPDAQLQADLEVVNAWRAEHQYPLALTMPGLRNWVRDAGGTVRPAQRMKQIQTIIEKLDRHPGMKLARMQDVAGCRAVLSDRTQVDAVAARMQSRWEVVRTADYRDQGRSDTGYRALHVMVAKQERVVEVQLRTDIEHRWAEVVASTGSRLGHPLKDGVGPAELVEYFRMASDLLYLESRDENFSRESVARFNELRQAVRPYFTNR